MKKVIVFLSAILLCFTSLVAQQFKVEKSEVFDDPGNGWNKVFQLKNGKTFYFHAANKEGLTITVYDKQRKQIAVHELESKIWDISDVADADIAGLYEISGEPVLFIYQNDKMYRIRLNPDNGALVNEEELTETGDEIKWRHHISVEKDPASDCYALIYKGFESKYGYDMGLKVAHYDGTHKKINEATYPANAPGFKYTRYDCALVDGSKSVYVVMEGYTRKPELSSSTSKIVLSKLSPGSKVFTHKIMKINLEFEDLRSTVVFNRQINKIQLVTTSLVDSKEKMLTHKVTKSYLTLINYIDPETMNLADIKPVYGQKVSEYGQAHIDKDYSYSGVPTGIFVNDDKSITVTMEEYGVVESKEVLGAIGISELNDTGAETAGYAIDKKQVTQGYSSGFTQNVKHKNRFSFPASNIIKNGQFMSYDYIATPRGHYVIFNDLADNIDKDEDEGRHKKMSSASSSSAIACKLSDSGIVKMVMFGEPEGRSSSTFCFINGSDYNKDNNTYATLIIEREGLKKHCRVAWVTF